MLQRVRSDWRGRSVHQVVVMLGGRKPCLVYRLLVGYLSPSQGPLPVQWRAI